MTFKKDWMPAQSYRDFVMSKCKSDFHQDPEQQNRAHVAHMALGVVGEFGEIDPALSVEKQLLELGDLNFYIHGLIEGVKRSGATENHLYELDMLLYPGELFDLGLRNDADDAMRAEFLKDLTQKAIYTLAEESKKYFAYGKFKNVTNVADSIRVLNEYVYRTAPKICTPEMCDVRTTDDAYHVVLHLNMDKLDGRYKSGFTSDEAIAKADQR